MIANITAKARAEMKAANWLRWIDDHAVIYEYAVNRVMATRIRLISRSDAERIVADLVDEDGPGLLVDWWRKDYPALYERAIRHAMRALAMQGHTESRLRSLAETCVDSIILEYGHP